MNLLLTSKAKILVDGGYEVAFEGQGHFYRFYIGREYERVVIETVGPDQAFEISLALDGIILTGFLRSEAGACYQIMIFLTDLEATFGIADEELVDHMFAAHPPAKITTRNVIATEAELRELAEDICEHCPSLQQLLMALAAKSQPSPTINHEHRVFCN